MAFYHCSPTAGLTLLRPGKPLFSEKPAMVYMTTLFPMALMYGIQNYEYTYGYTREGKGRLYLRQIPVPPLKQSLIKASLPFAASFLSLLLSLIVLVSFSLIDVSLFFAALFIGLVLLSALAVLGLEADAARLAIVKRKIGGYASALISLGLPLLLAALHFVLVFLTGFPTSLMYGLEIILACLVALPALLSFFLKNRRMIPEMRVDVL